MGGGGLVEGEEDEEKKDEEDVDAEEFHYTLLGEGEEILGGDD